MNKSDTDNFINILYKENEFLRNKIQILNQQNTSLYKIIHDMKELMVKFEHFPKLISYLESSLNEKDNEYSILKKKYDEEFYGLNEIINKQIESDDNEKKKKDEIIDGLNKTIQEIENQKFIDSNEYENRIFELESKIKRFLEKEKDYLKTQTDLVSEKEWITKSKNNEIIITENSKKEVEKQLNEVIKENETLKKQVLSYQQTIKTISHQQQTRPPGNNSNGTNINPILVISPSSSSSSNNTDEYQTKLNNNSSSTNHVNHLSSHNKKPISISRKSNWEYK